MKFLSALTLSTVMATFAAALDGPGTGGGDAVDTEVTIYNRPNYNGLRKSFVPNQDECHSLLPWIVSVRIPENEGIYCQLFDNSQCSGEGADVLVQSTDDIPLGLEYPGIICGYLD
ncbi:hypothetical protein BJY01DRAFT_136927 [Aspergillus pseudoustus]|uniref:Uncharacterized protein n=1 Tax=Aspergillus pseudoustus TaxID=1810923 RepID=A0ABR4KY81_9EURO